MSDIHHDAICACFQRGFYAAHFLVTHTHRRTDDQPSAGIFGGFRVLRNLHDVFQGHQPCHTPIGIDQRQLFDAVFMQQAFRFFKRNIGRGSDDLLLHQFSDGFFVIVFKEQIAGGDNADEFFFRIQNQNSACACFVHQFFDVADGVGGAH